MSEHPTAALLKAFLDTFNRHDLDAIMTYFADDCVFYMPRGVGPRGDRYVGKDEVRAGNAGLAQSKGKSRVTWFVLSLLLGPVATFLIVIADDPRRPSAGSAG
jgi:ketosteroid isomerase-like protein